MEDKHHAVYDPYGVIKPLCRKHHEDITIINGIQARKKHRKLRNNERWAIWYAWQRGELKPRRTKKALEWLNRGKLLKGE